MIEKWKFIKGYDDIYEVSNFGRIKSHYKHRGTSERILKPRFVKDGYLMVALYKDKKCNNVSVHKIVAEHFIKNPKNYVEINHKDGNKTNNYVENLEWISHYDNIQHYVKVLKGKSYV